MSLLSYGFSQIKLLFDLTTYWDIRKDLKDDEIELIKEILSNSEDIQRTIFVIQPHNEGHGVFKTRRDFKFIVDNYFKEKSQKIITDFFNLINEEEYEQFKAK